MKVKNIITAQIVLLVLAVLAGLALKGDLTSGVRNFHRLFGMLAGLAGLLTTITVYRDKSTTKQRTLAIVAFVLSLVAGAEGKMLKTTSNYSMTFNSMRISGMLALVASVMLLVSLKKQKSPAKPAAE